MRRSRAEKLGLSPRAVIVGHATYADQPAKFPTAPVHAIRRLSERTGWATSDVDLYEINEAFAVVAMAALRDLDLPHERVNIHGGARVMVTLLAALEKNGLSRGIASLCIGGGEATAVAIQRVS
jgi:acetyl-CoA C-acetyltransferase